MREPKLTPQERKIEEALINGEYITASKEKHAAMKAAIEAYKRNAVLHMRIRKGDLDALKQKAKQIGVKYQTYIAEILHRAAQS